MQQAPRDETLERFDRLVVRAKYEYFTFLLAEFQIAAASLESDERIKLEVTSTHTGMEWFKAVLVHPQDCEIRSVHWLYRMKEDANLVVPLLTNDCAELTSLLVDCRHPSAFDFVSSVLEHPSNKINALKLPKRAGGNLPRFFAALRQSQVSALSVFIGDSFEFAQGLREYLARDLLVSLEVWMDCEYMLVSLNVWMDSERVPSEIMLSLAKCTRLATLKLRECTLSASTHFPKSITKLKFYYCKVEGGLDWSFLADSNLRKLDLDSVRGVDGTQLGRALAVHLKAKGLDKLRFLGCPFVNEALAVVGVELGRIKRLDLDILNDASIALIALVSQSPNSEMKELELYYVGDTASSIKNHLVPALKHPSCRLIKLSMYAYEEEHEAAAKAVEDTFRNRRALFVLLQGQQVRKRYGPLRRLPVEMFRLVGMALI